MQRNVPLSTVAASVALLYGLGGCQGDEPGDSTPTPSAVTTKYELRGDMRELWTAHATWTRIYLMDAIAQLPDTPFAAERLLQNQTDIGNAIRPFYGNAAADELTSLLEDHITLAVTLVDAALAGDQDAMAAASADWYANGDDIAVFLADANPAWDEADLEEMMKTHLDQTTAEVLARMTGEWETDVLTYDMIVHHVLEMSDALTDGIAVQFPDQVLPSGVPEGEQELNVAMRGLWQDHVTWTRVYLISAIAGLPDNSQAAERLLRNQDDIGTAIVPFYGADAGADLAGLLRVHIVDAALLVDAAMQGDDEGVQAASDAWYANADEIAAFLADANPHWDEQALRDEMYMHLGQTLTEATARLEGDWGADVAAYDEVVTHILGMSDTLSDGLAEQFPDVVIGFGQEPLVVPPPAAWPGI